jgi:hypothetical protein
VSDDTPTLNEDNERNTLLLRTILDQEPGTIANIVQAATEYDDWQPPGTLYDRLSAAYHELTNTDPEAPNTQIRLRDEEDDDDDAGS